MMVRDCGVGAAQREQAGRIAGGGGELRDAFRRQDKIKITRKHACL